MAVENIAERRLGREAVLALRTVAEAIDVVRDVERDVAAGALSKVDTSPVTIADFGIQALIAARLGRDFPSDSLVAEEDASALRAAPNLTARVVDLVAHADPPLRAVIKSWTGSIEAGAAQAGDSGHWIPLMARRVYFAAGSTSSRER